MSEDFNVEEKWILADPVCAAFTLYWLEGCAGYFAERYGAQWPKVGSGKWVKDQFWVNYPFKPFCATLLFVKRQPGAWLSLKATKFNE